jgi:hypothetical protein
MSNPNPSPETSVKASKASRKVEPAPAAAPVPAPAPIVPPSVPPPAPEPELPPGPVLKDVVEIGVHVVAEVAPGVMRYISGVTEDGRVLACDQARKARVMHTADARELLANKAVRRDFPTAQIKGAE